MVVQREAWCEAGWKRRGTGVLGGWESWWWHSRALQHGVTVPQFGRLARFFWGWFCGRFLVGVCIWLFCGGSL